MLILTTATTGGGKEDNIILPILENLELFIRNIIKDKDYGADINDCIIYIYAVFPNMEENIKWGMPKNRIERRKDYYSEKGWIKTIVLVLLFDPDCVSKMTPEEFRVSLCNAILDKLENPNIKLLKTFNYKDFKDDISREIINYRDNFLSI
ncbi:hypothetical protein GPS47_07100 [Acinetobacter haemolyticus]|uniref:Uncharacterized protein n=1 Tax=Acinetobacter haemolyticus TaxID=29430 RepID=A0A372MND9_ACIHA|nr:hypothetical protein [Acinetobacter haemolyticus]NAR53372.1 hypothetical protein [Acinetobacter haemolyticus]NAR55842.1 hypothetical protein [Acinetobacter haemolyticus]NAR78900.1 hypothetical protein [Acinetobacter haemolyticus]NAR86511.1 hypothetical protein [Acinetobacter haemolyticus]NAR95920.1 hypothetical protein [Acinetobacter haemolyticus]